MAKSCCVSSCKANYKQGEYIPVFVFPSDWRFVWNFFRLENEHLNNCGKFRAVRDISVAPIDSSDQAQILRMMDDEDGVVNRHKKKTGKKKEDTKLLMPECSEPSSFLEVP